MNRLSILAAALLCLTLTAAAQETAQQPHPADALRPVPHPDLGALEPLVAGQLGKMRDILQSILDESRSDPQALHDAYGELGQLYHAYGFAEAAEVCYLNALYIRPRTFELLYLMGVLQQEAGRLDDAEASLQAALELRRGDLAVTVRLGQVYQALNRLDDAAALMRRALELDPGCAAARAALGEIALSEGRHQEAVDELERVLAEVPAANRLHYPLGLAYRGLGEKDRAREHLAQRGTVGVRPPDPLVEGLEELKQGERVHLLRGRMAFGAGRYREAAEAFAAAVEALPESSRARVNLGTTLGILGEYEAAEGQYREALELDPDNHTAHYNLGSLRARAGDDEAAVRHLRSAIAGDDADVAAHLELARVLRRSGEAAEARQHFVRAAELDPANEDARLGEAAILIEEERWAEARRCLAEANAVLPQAGRVAHALARLLAGCPDLGERDGARALDLAQRVWDAVPDARHAATVAMALAELDRCSEAVTWQRRAIALAQEAGETGLVPELGGTLRHYEANEPCRVPGSTPPPQP